MAISEGTVVTSRIRFARNVSGYFFGSRLTQKNKAREIVSKTYYAASKYCGFKLIEIGKIAPLEAERLKERYVISEALKSNASTGAVLVSENELFCIMINEEDHVREQRLEKGFALKKAYEALAPLDRWLDKNLKFCKDEKYGYLTACPTNLGSGLRASCMMFLPGLTKRQMIGALLSKAEAKGLTVRGVFGEGSGVESCLYQVSNEVTLGITPERIVSEVEGFVEEIAELEKTNLEIYYSENTIKLQDSCYRALGTLSSCRILRYDEFSSLLSEVKTGAMLGFINLKSVSALDDMLVTGRSAGIKSELEAQGTAVSELSESVYRADYVRECLKKLAD